MLKDRRYPLSNIVGTYQYISHTMSNDKLTVKQSLIASDEVQSQGEISSENDRGNPRR